MNNQVNWLQQGWECPKCGAVMSPTTACCVNCRGNRGGGTATTITNPLTMDEWIKQQSLPSSLCSSDSSVTSVYGEITARNTEDPEEQWERYQLNV